MTIRSTRRGLAAFGLALVLVGAACGSSGTKRSPSTSEAVTTTTLDDRGPEAACKATKASVATALEAYYAKNNSYPATLKLLTPDFVQDFGGAKLDAAGTALRSDDGGWTLTYRLGDGYTLSGC